MIVTAFNKGGKNILFLGKNTKACAFGLTLLFALVTVAGCGSKQAAKTGGAAQVKAMKVIQQDTPLSYEYAGQIKGKDEVKVQSKVSGTIVEKYVTGGQTVHAGQALYKIDSRQYESALLSAQATLAQSQASLNNAQIDLQRDQELLASNAISEQSVTTQSSSVQQYSAAADSNSALVKKAQENLDDTIVYAPLDGRVSVDDVAIGTYASAGSTTLVTIGTIDPVYVQFNISENEYLKFMNLNQSNAMNQQNASVSLTLSDGSAYPVTGQIQQVDRALGDNTGTLSVKALFGNPNNMLLPGMFARVKVSGEVLPNAILVPQRAVQQLLDKSFVIVVGSDNKSESRAVKLGEKVGSFWIVKEGLSADDTVVVEGLTKLQAGVDLDVTMVTPEDLKLSMNS
jgi:membrane fusion protein, multidrug efflux system